MFLKKENNNNSLVLICSIIHELKQSIKKPKLFWISAAAPLTSVILSTLLVFLLRTKVPRIAVVRTDIIKLQIGTPKLIPTRIVIYNQLLISSFGVLYIDWSFARGLESSISEHAVLFWF